MSRLPQVATPRVIIIGAGLAGLCLAQGLRKAGVSVAVYERDASAAARAQGYRVTIDKRGMDGLRDCVPPRLYQLFEATWGQPSTGLTMFSSDGSTLREDSTTRFPTEVRPGVPLAGRAVDRLTLREILLAGLDDAVHFGKELIGYQMLPDGVQARFGDGSTASGDLLVGADGVNSRVRQQHLPEFAPVDAGIRWVGGRTVLDSRLRGLLPDALSDRAATVRSGGILVFLASLLFQQKPQVAAHALWPGLQFTDNQDFLMWAIVGEKDRMMRPEEELAAASPAALHSLALEATVRAHPMLRAVVEAADADRSFFLAVRAIPIVDQRPGSRVTLLGDAMHASPVNGTGANSALQDAALLCRHLCRAAQQHGSLEGAVHKFEAEMLSEVRSTRAAMHAAWKHMTWNDAWKSPGELGLT